MRKAFQSLILAAVVLLGFTTSCKQDAPKTQKPVSKTVVEKKVVNDSTAVDSAMIAKPKQVIKETVPPPPPDKYFLIAGSFQSRENAETFKSNLESQGFTSQIIERKTGPNNDFYKVSYKSFYDRHEAYAELRKARNTDNKDDVWLLVKR